MLPCLLFWELLFLARSQMCLSAHDSCKKADCTNCGVQTLMLSNTQPFPAEFKWQLEGPAAAAFSVSPAEGTIRGSNSLQCTVKWMPGSDATPGEQVVSQFSPSQCRQLHPREGDGPACTPWCRVAGNAMCSMVAGRLEGAWHASEYRCPLTSWSDPLRHKQQWPPTI